MIGGKRATTIELKFKDLIASGNRLSVEDVAAVQTSTNSYAFNILRPVLDHLSVCALGVNMIVYD